ncbi:hypothetical protein [Olsenella uli]|uniref:hypothetical protein n=1 Tax=Olsenella uli TaxID=133926 RepID=UPI0012AB937E|nr:hypothetical protein [Olsenella uli]
MQVIEGKAKLGVLGRGLGSSAARGIIGTPGVLGPCHLGSDIVSAIIAARGILGCRCLGNSIVPDAIAVPGITTISSGTSAPEA